MRQALLRQFREALPSGVDHVSVRFVSEKSTQVAVRNDVVQPPGVGTDAGLMVTVHEGGGLGYAATSDTSPAGLRTAIERARRWSRAVAGRSVIDTSKLRMPRPTGDWAGPVVRPWSDLPVRERVDRLRRICAAAAAPKDIALREASVVESTTESLYVTSDGAELFQQRTGIVPEIMVFASRGGQSQRRTMGGMRGASRLGGVEIVDGYAMEDAARQIRDEALLLLDAPQCPTGTMDVVLAPDQMMLQIHESIGHPLELDRILGDERNFAGTSFVTPDMFGTYRYGSEHLTVSFAPDEPGEFASYGWDDDGARGERLLLIDKGLLVRALGGTVSQARSGIAGVANSRASSWNRAPIDRMANLNVEPGDCTFSELVAGVERGVYLQTNLSWSIDDSRNKFQFGCEFGREIVDGQLGRVVRNPNYRGISASFWRTLHRAGDRSTYRVLGTPFCGKGEPSQVIGVGHASPACHFRQVDVFGGAA